MNAGAIHDVVLNISAVERETGLSKDVLRVWERRYGFPNPLRDGRGEREYALADMVKLRAIRRLMDAGMRPGKLIGLSMGELDVLADARAPVHRDPANPALAREVIALLKAGDPVALRRALTRWLMTQGLQLFVLNTLAPLTRALGVAWMRGEIAVFEERLYTEQAQQTLRAGIDALARERGSPRILLTTLPGEQHALELLMAEAVFACEGAQCIFLGVQMSQEDVRLAARAYESEIVALSFSVAFPLRQATDALAALQRALPEHTALWAGGEAMRRLRSAPQGVVLLADLAAAATALRSWRAQFSPPDAT